MSIKQIAAELGHGVQTIEQDVAQDIEKALKDLTADAVKSAAEPHQHGGFGTNFGDDIEGRQ